VKALRVIEGKWKVPIIWHLLGGTKRFIGQIMKRNQDFFKVPPFFGEEVFNGRGNSRMLLPLNYSIRLELPQFIAEHSSPNSGQQLPEFA
jgi:hypothetical protein